MNKLNKILTAISIIMSVISLQYDKMDYAILFLVWAVFFKIKD